jgi:hypothetical protein
MLDDLLGALKQGVLNALQQKTGVDLGARTGPAPAADPIGFAARPVPAGETVDAVLPLAAGEFVRRRVNDRFGGIRSGGIFAGYAGAGVEVRVLVTLLRSAEAAREQVRQSAADGTTHSFGTEPSYSLAPGSAVWSRGPYCFSASSSDTEGDEPLPPTPEQVAALERFLRAFPY